jgi:hypothetical protein
MIKTLNFLVSSLSATLLAVSVQAAEPVQAPPAAFIHEAANMRIWHYAPAKVDDLCRRLVTHSRNPYRSSGSGTFHACAIGGQAQCILIMPTRSAVTSASYDRLLRHERAHCNGWSHG